MTKLLPVICPLILLISKQAQSATRQLGNGHRQSLTYDDFGAHSLAPYGQWAVPNSRSEDFYNISPVSYCGGDPINRIDLDGCVINNLAAISGVAQGAVTGAAAGFTMGMNLVGTTIATGIANAEGGIINREIQGKATNISDVLIDASIGAGTSLIGSSVGRTSILYTNNLTNKAKGNLGEKISLVKYTLRGFKTKGEAKVEIETLRLNGNPRNAHFDFGFKNIFTGKRIIVESKFNTSGLTPNQRMAIKQTGLPVIIDRTTSKQIGNALDATVRGSSGLIGNRIED